MHNLSFVDRIEPTDAPIMEVQFAASDQLKTAFQLGTADNVFRMVVALAERGSLARFQSERRLGGAWRRHVR